MFIELIQHVESVDLGELNRYIPLLFPLQVLL